MEATAEKAAADSSVTTATVRTGAAWCRAGLLAPVQNPYRTTDASDREYGAGGRIRRAQGIEYEHDADGQPTAKPDVLGDLTRYRGNGAGRLESVLLPDGRDAADGHEPLDLALIAPYEESVSIEETLRRHSEWTLSEEGSPATLSSAVIADLDFSTFNLRGLSLIDCSISGCSFSGADAVDLCIQHTTLRDCTFDNAVLASLQVNDTTFDRCNLAGADVSAAIVSDSRFEASALPYCNLTKASFYRCYLEGASLAGAAAKKTYWDGCNLRRVRCADAILSSAHFVDCDLREASFKGARLERTSLTSCAVYGISGPAQLSGNVRTAVIAENCDSSAAADRTQPASEASVVGMLRR